MEDKLRSRYHREQSEDNQGLSSETTWATPSANARTQGLDVPLKAMTSEQQLPEDEISLLVDTDQKIQTDCLDENEWLDPHELCPQQPAYCVACTTTRLVMTPMILIVLGLVYLTYYAYVFETKDITILELVIFHIAVAFLLISYFQCMLLDPGSVPMRWHNAVKMSDERAHYQLCWRTEVYKPPRSHYDNITKRQVLNMDHFCPWVVNCVGFYNRKFFILFLFWTSFACLQFTLTTLLRAGASMASILLDANNRLTMVKFCAFIMDAALAMAVPAFLAFHVKLMYYNQTTMDEGDEYDLGWRNNIASVMGANPWLWLVPVYGAGPVGDGIHWAPPHRDSDRVPAAAEAAAGPSAAVGGGVGGGVGGPAAAGMVQRVTDASAGRADNV